MALTHPYADIDGIQPLRGNLHAHTDRSDGTAAPQEVVDHYVRLGYDFLMLSDHDVYTSEADLASLDSHGMVLIPGNEVSKDGPHLLHIGAGGFITPDPQRQRVISRIAQAGGLAVINHPDWGPHYNHCTMDQLHEWVDYTGVEIYNGVIGRLKGSPYATNKWDQLLTAGRRIWGLANDDSHRPDTDIGLGWNMVYAADRTPAGIVDALRTGRFYASSGVVITHIEVSGDTIRIRTDNARRICALSQWSTRIAFADDDHIEVTVPPDASYIRFECWGEGEAFAWTQPFFNERIAASTP